jgi:hypothetical protein
MASGIYRRWQSGRERNKWFVLKAEVGVSRSGSFLFRGLYKIIYQAERDKCQRQDDQKEDEAAQTAILETLPARDFDAIKYPVGNEVEAASDQCVVNDFHVNAP